ncbi:MAG: hypothetical protein H6723_14255 [Sandaracinus sp.]|nr:hypothetical protein [Sandaracinus sp.]
MKTWPFAALALTSVSLLGSGTSFAQEGDTVVIVEGADGATRVVALPYEAPTPAATPAPAEEAPVVLILPPGTQVRLLAEELAPPVAPPPAVPPPPVAPAPTVVAPDFAPSIELQYLRLQTRERELVRERPGLGWPLTMLIGGSVTTFLSSVGLAGALDVCDAGERCGGARRSAAALLVGVGVLAYGLVRVMVTSRRRRAIGREIREIRRQLSYLSGGLPLR